MNGAAKDIHRACSITESGKHHRCFLHADLKQAAVVTGAYKIIYKRKDMLFLLNALAFK